LVALLPSVNHSPAVVIEEVVTLPVSVKDDGGPLLNHSITLTLFRDDAKERTPFLILNHGRPGSAERRAAFGRARYPGNSRYFVEQGFAVFIPTRIGYGVTGGPDLEYSGPCANRNFPPAYEAAAQQSLAVIAYAKAQPYSDGEGLVVGHSFGGVVALALAAKNIPGVRGAINFAGGGGGDPERSPDRPCRSDLMASLLAAYGRSAKAPTLWLYSENDRYWGPALPRSWFDGYVAAGGHARFVALRPSGEDGHRSFIADPTAWRSEFERFISELRRR
jgi:dienelactone hydrolase